MLRMRPFACIGLLVATEATRLSAQLAQAWNPQQVLHTETYVRPPAGVERIITAPLTDIAFTMPSPDRKWLVRTSGADRGDVNALAKGKPMFSSKYFGFDFQNKTIDFQFTRSKKLYGGMKLDPGINGGGNNNAQGSKMNLDVFARYNSFLIKNSFYLGPELALRIVNASKVADNMEPYINFAASYKANLDGPVFLYCHVPLIGLQITSAAGAKANTSTHEVIYKSLGWPIEFGVMTKF